MKGGRWGKAKLVAKQGRSKSFLTAYGKSSKSEAWGGTLGLVQDFSKKFFMRPGLVFRRHPSN